MTEFIQFLDRKPFVSTVRSGEQLLKPLSDHNANQLIRCTKCSIGYNQKLSGISTSVLQAESKISKLENKIKDLLDELECCKRKV